MGKCMSKPAVAVTDHRPLSPSRQGQSNRNHPNNKQPTTNTKNKNNNRLPPISNNNKKYGSNNNNNNNKTSSHYSSSKKKTKSHHSTTTTNNTTTNNNKYDRSRSKTPMISNRSSGSRSNTNYTNKSSNTTNTNPNTSTHNNVNAVKMSSSKSRKKSQQQQQQQQQQQAVVVDSEKEERWKELVMSAVSRIVDPADVVAVMDERISAIVDKLNPAEVTFLQRRVRSELSSSSNNSSNNSSSNDSNDYSKRRRGKSNGHVDESTKSRSIYAKEYVLDESIFRKLFVAAEHILSHGHQTNLPSTLRTQHTTNTSLSITKEEEEEEEAPFDEAQHSPTRKHNSWNNTSVISKSFSKLPNNNSSSQYSSSVSTTSVSSSNHKSQVDPIGSAYLLLLYLADSRWEYVSAIAQMTAKQAQLTLDINQQQQQQQSQQQSPVPRPSVLNPNKKNPPPLPSGISFANLCFLLSMALRGSRTQKITLLFYLLLPPDTLKALLQSHPAGGSPTWLLEVDASEYISFASLSHYYYYDTKQTVHAKSAIQVIATLLHGSQQPPPPQQQQQQLGTPEGSNSPKQIQMWKQFWSSSSYPLDHPQVSWNIHQFMDWANVALLDDALYQVLEQLFGNGILPSASMEKYMVEQSWYEWQQQSAYQYYYRNNNNNNTTSITSHHVSAMVRETFCHLFSITNDNDNHHHNHNHLTKHKVYHAWGQIGGLDGLGGLGYGIMYCIDKKWWESWLRYIQYDNTTTNTTKTRPHDLSNEILMDKYDYLPGAMGSYEVIRTDAKKDVDYVLIPPAVWDILYELYGGGPPLPRMVLPFTTTTTKTVTREASFDTMDSVEVAYIDTNTNDHRSPLQIPNELDVLTQPWIIHCHACDPHQPYRRGDVGPISIRIMASPDQPLWRLFGEISVRLPVNYPRAKDVNHRGRARLWKKVENMQESPSGASRYGPWLLLCKSRFASFPTNSDESNVTPDDIEFFKKEWEGYGDHATVESIGLTDGSKLMFEYALLRKDGNFAWPREAAAKAGRLKRVADEDIVFRRMLRGVDENNKLIKGHSPLIGKLLDAMDSSGRWYQVAITAIDNTVVRTNDDDDSENDNGYDKRSESKTSDSRRTTGETRAVRVDFREFGGHEEWIDVNSDKLAASGRFTMDSVRNLNSGPGEFPANSASGDSKPRLTTGSKRNVMPNDSSTDLTNSGAVCPFPGFGACGLTNLGNTCYANSALQCISYMPLLRSYLLSGQFKICGDLNKDNPLGTGGKLLEEFAELMKTMWSAKYGSRAPGRFRAQLGKARNQYAAADQQDAQELLNDMLDSLHEDSNKIKKKPYVEAIDDAWVETKGLPRVGNETWRRFLRRNRSIIADVAMGQVLNRVTCPTCNFTSRNFDPFNMLSIPFPSIAEVIFRCRVFRRANYFNCANTLSNEGKFENGKTTSHDPDKRSLNPPSNGLIMEEYVIPMSRLADIGDLRLQIQKLSGISSNRLKLCKSEEIIVNSETDVKSRCRTYVKVSALPDKEGPCVQLARKSSNDDISTPVAPTTIIAFESTLSNRPADSKKYENVNKIENSDASTNDDSTDDEEDDDSIPLRRNNKATSQNPMLQEYFASYGDKLECKLYDTNPLLLAKAMSRSMWPKSSSGFKLGLRVDAIDHRDHWFPGSIVEIIEGNDDGSLEDDGSRKTTKKTQVRIHFDNFSSKWDEKYTIDHFQCNQVQPLYSHANPKAKPTEFVVHHRHNRTGKGNSLFGQAFFVQCHIEWSTVRAGAQILAQAARFLQPPPFYPSGCKDLNNEEMKQKIRHRMENLGFHPTDMPNEKELDVYRIADEINPVMSEIIDVLIEFDKIYVNSALSISTSIKDKKTTSNSNSSFNVTAMSSRLSKKLTCLLPLLPFEIRICAADSLFGAQQGSSSDEVAFPFSLVRTIGNYMNARHAVVLHWRESTKFSRSERHPLMYIPPYIGVHEEGRSILTGVENNETDQIKKEKGKRNNNAGSHGGIPLGVCLTEFCKEQQLQTSECWRCPKCKEVREGNQSMTLWRLPDLLTFHIKRFSCSARWREKITTKVNFPLTSLNMKEWCDQQSPAFNGSEDSYVYDLIGVVNHYGGMTGGHYIATCKATPCGPDGSEEVSHNFSGTGISKFDTEEEASQSGGWKIGRNKDRDTATMQNRVATATARSVSKSSEPLWLQFDDDLVEPIPPKTVVSEMAYVLFYRRRRISPSNIAKYSTVE